MDGLVKVGCLGRNCIEGGGNPELNYDGAPRILHAVVENSRQMDRLGGFGIYLKRSINVDQRGEEGSTREIENMWYVNLIHMSFGGSEYI